jgi:hypothetical protein
MGKKVHYVIIEDAGPGFEPIALGSYANFEKAVGKAYIMAGEHVHDVIEEGHVRAMSENLSELKKCTNDHGYKIEVSYPDGAGVTFYILASYNWDTEPDD